MAFGLNGLIPNLPAAHKLWLNRVTLDAIWQAGVFWILRLFQFYPIDPVFEMLMTGGDETPIVLKTLFSHHDNRSGTSDWYS